MLPMVELAVGFAIFQGGSCGWVLLPFLLRTVQVRPWNNPATDSDLCAPPSDGLI
jgi:hypothetical protein